MRRPGTDNHRPGFDAESSKPPAAIIRAETFCTGAGDAAHVSHGATAQEYSLRFCGKIDQVGEPADHRFLDGSAYRRSPVTTDVFIEKADHSMRQRIAGQPRRCDPAEETGVRVAPRVAFGCVADLCHQLLEAVTSLRIALIDQRGDIRCSGRANNRRPGALLLQIRKRSIQIDCGCPVRSSSGSRRGGCLGTCRCVLARTVEGADCRTRRRGLKLGLKSAD